MKFCPIAAILLTSLSLSLAGCSKVEEQLYAEVQEHEGGHDEQHEVHGHPAHKILVTSPVRKDVISTQQYVCQIHSQRHIQIRALERGYLEQIPVREGQVVKEGDPLFKVIPVLYHAPRRGFASPPVANPPDPSPPTEGSLA